jgi:hypothetical protein
MRNALRRASPPALLGIALAIGILVAAAAATPIAGGAQAKVVCTLAGAHYRGTSSQRQRVCFTVSKDGRKLVEFAYGFRDNCGSTGDSRTTNSRRGYVAAIAPGGAFSYGTAQSYFKGMVKGGTASGTLRSRGYNAGIGQTCDTGAIRWSARRS